MAQNELINVYLKEQTEYTQNQINKIRDLVKERQSGIAWQKVNELGRTKCSARAILKASSKEERTHLLKQHFEDLLGKHQKVTCPVGWAFRIHRLHLCRKLRPTPTSVLDMTWNNLIVRFQWRWGFGECGAGRHCHCFQVHSGPEW